MIFRTVQFVYLSTKELCKTKAIMGNRSKTCQVAV